MTVWPPKLISLLESLKGQFQVLYFLPSIPLHWAAWSVDTICHASCMCHLHQMTAAALNSLQSCLASVQSWLSMNKLKLNPDETEFLLIGNEQQRDKYISIFPIELFGVKINPAKYAQNLGTNFRHELHLPLTYICSLQLMVLPHSGSVAYSLLPWSG